MADAKKCGNVSCTCILPEKERYCSPQCEAVAEAGAVEVLCECGHPSCKGDALIT
jgi:hypothetical protein